MASYPEAKCSGHFLAGFLACSRLDGLPIPFAGTVAW